MKFYFSNLVPIFGRLSSYVVVGIRSYISKICHLIEEGIYQLFFEEKKILSQGEIFSIIASFELIDALIGSVLFILACFLHFLTLCKYFNNKQIKRYRLIRIIIFLMDC